MKTWVRYCHIDAERATRLIFGRPEFTEKISEFESKARFIDGQIFGLQVYNDLAYGAFRWAFYVLEVSNNPSKISFIPNVVPGARILLEVRGIKKVRIALDWVNGLDGETLAGFKRHHFLRQHGVFNTDFGS